MIIKSDFPFEQYTVYKNFHKKMKRMQCCLVNKNDYNDRRTLTYAKYILSVKLGRILNSEEEVDHINGDKTDDRTENLQILTRAQHKEKTLSETPIAAMTVIICKMCEKEFETLTKNIKFKLEKNKHIFCSRSCCAIFYMRYKGNPIIRAGATNV